jgi:hypothetical protein
MAFPLCLLVVAGVAPAGADRLPGEYYNEMHFDLQTPHTPWGKPLAGGPVRAFFLAPAHAAREVTELAQRLDMQVSGETTIYDQSLGNESRYVAMIAGTSGVEKKCSVLAKLQEPYDVYVIGNFPLEKLPLEIQFEILRRVKEGAGLLLCYRHKALDPMWRHPIESASELVREAPVAGLTFYRERFPEAAGIEEVADIPASLVQGFRLGEGRIALVDYAISSRAGIAGAFCLTPDEPYTWRTLTEYDYHQSLVAKALLWAAGRESAVRFTDLPVEGLQLASDAPANTVQVEVANASADAISGRLEVSVRSEWGEAEHSAQSRVRLPADGETVEVSLPRLPGGTHFLDLRFVSERGVEGWAGAALLVDSPVRIEEVALTKLGFERTEACKGTVRLAPAVEGDAWSLRVSLLDNYGRLFAERDRPLAAGATEADFDLPLDQSVSLAARARVALVREGLVMDRAEAEFFVAQRNADYFPALVWGNYPGIFGHFCAEQLHAAGFNSILHYYGTGSGEGRTPASIAREDMHAIPYVTRLGPNAWHDGRLGDIAADTKANEFMRERAEMSRLFDPLVYSLGDENRIPGDAGYHENERPAFVEFVKGRYVDVAALNEAWGTELGSFDEATPIKPNDARDARYFARYHDTEAFREYLYANWHRYNHDLIREVDPYARVGAEGSVPGEMELSIQGLDFWGPYRRTDQNALLRSLAPRSLLRGNWFGAYNHGRSDLPGLPRFLWESVLDGSTLLELYCSYTCETFYKSDLSWAYWMDWILPDLGKITDGIGQLLTRSEHSCDAVAVYHSQPSVHFEKRNAAFGKYEMAHRAALRMLEDLSFVPSSVTGRGVEAGALADNAPRVLVMPHAVALSDAEVEAIEGFVRAGGVLIADVRPGIADGRCNLRATGALSDLFGIVSGEPLGSPVSAEAAISGAWDSPALSFSVAAAAMPIIHADAGVTVAGGAALGSAGDAPLCVCNRFGDGAAVLLNFSLGDYGTPGPDGRPELLDLFEGIFSGTGLRPNWGLTADDGRPLAGGRVSAFTRGPASVVGLLPSRPEPWDALVPATLICAEPRHLYDLRAAKYLGRADRTDLSLKFTSATLIAALPWRVESLQVTAPERFTAGGPCTVQVRLRADGDTAGALPVFRVNVIGPDGADRHYYARTLAPEGLEAETVVPFAANDPPGDWRITARDMLTGASATAVVRLEGPK